MSLATIFFVAFGAAVVVVEASAVHSIVHQMFAPLMAVMGG